MWYSFAGSLRVGEASCKHACDSKVRFCEWSLSSVLWLSLKGALQPIENWVMFLLKDLFKTGTV